MMITTNPTLNSDADEGLALAHRWREKTMAALVPKLPVDDLSWWTDSREARELARTLHKDQTRTGTDDAYFLHLAEVAAIIGAFNAAGLFSTPTEYRLALTTAWLHDAAEDQGFAIDDISKRFGVDAAGCVDAMTKRSKAQSSDTMTDSLERLVQSGSVASMVKAADRISNLSWKRPSTWSLKKSRSYGMQGRLIAATLAPALPPLARLALETVSDAYVCACEPTISGNRPGP